MKKLLIAGIVVFFCTNFLFAETYTGTNGEKLDAAVDTSGTLHLTYKRGGTVYYKRYKNQSWSQEYTVPGSQGTYGSRWVARVAADYEGSAHIIWADQNMNAIHYNSIDQHGNWSGHDQAIIDKSGGPDTNRCDITVNRKGEIFVAAQNDFAITVNIKWMNAKWNHSQYHTLYRSDDEPKNPAIQAQAANNNVTCTYSRSGIMYYNTYENGSWSTSKQYAGENECCLNYSNITFNNYGIESYIWILWKDGEDYSTLMYQSSNATNKLIDSPEYFYCPLDECPIPQVAVTDNGQVMAVWATGDNASRVTVAKKITLSRWSMEQVATTTYQNYPALVAVGNTFYVLWSDIRSDGGIYMREYVVGNNDPTPTVTPVITATATEVVPTMTPTDSLDPTFTPTEIIVIPTPTPTHFPDEPIQWCCTINKNVRTDNMGSAVSFFLPLFICGIFYYIRKRK